MTDSDTLWCLRTFQMTALKGVWGVPRSGLVFQKTSLDPPMMELIAAMPYEEAMPIEGEEGLKEFQREDLAIIKEKFKLAGITITGEIT